MNRLIRFGRNGVCIGQPISFMTKRAKPKNTQIGSTSASGAPVPGVELTRIPGVWTDATTVTWIWYSGTTERQAGGSQYTILAADQGSTVSFTETAIGPGGAASQQSAGVVVP